MGASENFRRPSLPLKGLIMSKEKTLRKELESEFACLKDFGVTKEELEAIYEMCGLKEKSTFFFKNKAHSSPRIGGIMNKSRISDEIAEAMAKILKLFKNAGNALEDFRFNLTKANTCEDLKKIREFWLGDGAGAARLYADGGDEAYGIAMREFNAKKLHLHCS